jgi:hypothetical protein
LSSYRKEFNHPDQGICPVIGRNFSFWEAVNTCIEAEQQKLHSNSSPDQGSAQIIVNKIIENSSLISKIPIAMFKKVDTKYETSVD